MVSLGVSSSSNGKVFKSSANASNGVPTPESITTLLSFRNCLAPFSSAALLNGARQFLKDNLVIMDSGVGSHLHALADEINVPFETEETPRDTATV